MTLPLERIATAIDQDTALVALSHTTFKSSFRHDLAAVTALAHEHGALVLWDLSHSVGAMPIALAEAGADLAIGCTYKYLNGGPGAPAFLFVRRELQDRLANPISGWLGDARPFEFALEHRPADGIRRFVTGTPPILSLAAVEPGVDLVLEAGVEAVRRKSVAQTEYLIALAETELVPLGFEIGTPLAPEQRGSHVALRHPEGLRIAHAAREHMGLLPDFRRPDSIRLGVSPLYTSFHEIDEAIRRLADLVRDGGHLRVAIDDAKIT
jgi:kynureninase